MIKRISKEYTVIHTADTFLRASGLNKESFKKYIDSLSEYEYKCLVELINYLAMDALIVFDELIFNKADYLGRGYFTVRIPFTKGFLKWKVVAPEGLFKFVQFYAFGIYKCHFTLEEVLN